MLIIVPTRSRPQNVAKVVQDWEETGAFEDGARLMFALDGDDPKSGLYDLALAGVAASPVSAFIVPQWKPMVHKLDSCARFMADEERHFAIGFAGDDHLPRTDGWANEYIENLIELGTGIVSCPDGYRRDDLPTQWARTSDIVRALGRMVPASVEHLYCDDAIRDLGKALGRYRYLDDVLIEHMHPIAGKADVDDQYDRVNSRGQYRYDRGEYLLWRDGVSSRSLTRDAATIRNIIERN